MARLALLLALALVVVGLVALLLGPARKSVSRVGGLALAALVAGLLTAPAIGITIALWQGAHGIDVPWRQLAEDILALTVFRLLPVFLAFARPRIMSVASWRLSCSAMRPQKAR